MDNTDQPKQSAANVEPSWMGVRIPTGLIEQVQVIARADRTGVTDVIITAINEYILRRDIKPDSQPGRDAQ